MERLIRLSRKKKMKEFTGEMISKWDEDAGNCFGKNKIYTVQSVLSQTKTNFTYRFQVVMREDLVSEKFLRKFALSMARLGKPHIEHKDCLDAIGSLEQYIEGTITMNDLKNVNAKISDLLDNMSTEQLGGIPSPKYKSYWGIYYATLPDAAKAADAVRCYGYIPIADNEPNNDSDAAINRQLKAHGKFVEFKLKEMIDEGIKAGEVF